MQSEQESAQPAAGRLARKNGHRIYDDHERVDLDAELLAPAVPAHHLPQRREVCLRQLYLPEEPAVVRDGR